MASVLYNPDDYMQSAFAPAEARFKESVLRDTWGHLAPKRNKKYKGFMVFAKSAYGGLHVLINADFAELEDSPWLYDAMYDYVCDHPGEGGEIYRFDGCIRNYSFEGNVVCISQLPGVNT